MSERDKLSERDKKFHPYLTNKTDGCGTLLAIFITAAIVISIFFVVV